MIGSRVPLVLLCLLFLFASLEMRSVMGEESCERYSGTWRGWCFNSDHCNSQCRSQEEALGGACQALACVCYYCG
ncbi:hypothetical protein K7X08_011693 [Anisodus acutangulus]|uniref:Knottins-like domain-containing protein n=1 Tax=Anisodus acutangulus TaxID=402998 RepID=A0A9Q1MQI7_9SOLA|nr:hypothetical protein K7X08_011693 [Anisodus acutangulus]